MRPRAKALAAIAAFGVLAAGEFALTRALAPAASLSESGIAAIGGPFSLIDDRGAPVTQASLAGKPSAIYFGYTYCPEACPTTLADLSRWIKQLGPSADKINFVFVTIDPARDRVNTLHEYLSSFDPHIRGYTGSEAQVAQIAKEYKVYYKKVPSEGGGYLMDHTSLIYLMKADGAYSGFIQYQEQDASAVAKLKALAANKGGNA
jgi:protein SCO1/2